MTAEPGHGAARGWTGVLGGSFDPVHLGHLRIALAVQRVFTLPRVLLVPCATPPHKPAAQLSAARHRLEMLRLAIPGLEGIEVSTVELERGGISFTVDTLRQLRRAGSAGRPLFVLGMDSLLDLPSWHEPRALLEEFDHVAVDRPGSDPARGLPAWICDRLVPVSSGAGAGAERLRERSAAGGVIYRLTLEPIPISSRRIRERARRGRSLTGLVPSEVARYIREEGLYTREGAR